MGLRGLEGKVAVVTGAGGGLGSAVARRLADEGVSVVVVDRDVDRAEAVASELPDAIAVGADVTQERDVARYMAAAEERYGRVDLHHLNAGISGQPRLQLTETTVEEWDTVMAVNLRGPFLGIRAAFSSYMRRGTPGAIVVTSSIASLRGASDLLAYTTSKHGVNGLVHGAAVAGGPIGVRVNAVAPGIVPTPIFGPAGIDDMKRRASTSPMRRAGTAEEIAGAVAYLLSDDAGYVNGAVLSADGGASVQNTNRDAGGAGLWDTQELDQDLLDAFHG